MTIDSTTLIHRLIDLPRSNGPVYVKVTTSTHVIWVDITDVTVASATEAPWVDNALVLEARPIDERARARMHRPETEGGAEEEIAREASAVRTAIRVVEGSEYIAMAGPKEAREDERESLRLHPREDPAEDPAESMYDGVDWTMP